MRRIYKRKAMAVALAGVLSIPLLAQAQSNRIEEVLVTVQKQAQSMNDVGIAISAFTDGQLKDLGITNPMDMAAHTPGLVLTETQPAGIPIYTIRGVGFDDISISSSSTVGVYIDQVALPYPIMTRGAAFDVMRAEVLKGPQGDLYGRNNTGGAINFLSNLPTEDFEAGVSLDYGRYEYSKLDGYVSGALSDDVNGRVAITTTQQGEGWQKSTTTGEKHGERDEFSGRVLLSWMPTDTVEVLFNVHASKDQSDNQAAFAVKTHNQGFPVTKHNDPISVTGDPTQYAGLMGADTPQQRFLTPAEVDTYVQQSKDPRAADWSLKPERDNNSWGTSLTIDWEIGEDYALTSITAFDTFEREESFDYDGTALELQDIKNDSSIDSFSQELRLTYDGLEDLTWISGLYYSTDTVEEEILGNISNSYSGSGGAFGFNEYAQTYEQDTDTLGVFGHAEWQFSDEFRLTLGGRYTHEEREWSGCSYDVDGGLAFLYNNIFGFTKDTGQPFTQGECVTIDTVAGLSGPLTSSDYGVFNDTITTENVSGKIGLDYLPNDDWLIYATIGTGFKSGGYNGNPANDYSQLEAYDEEELLAYELGFKATLLESSMQINGAAFYYDYTDKQIYDAVDTAFGPLARLTNIPDSTIQGAELEVQWRPLAGLDIKLAASYLDAEINEYTDFYGEDAEGKALPQTPEWQYNGLLSYEFPISESLLVRATTDFSYSDGYHTLISDGGDYVNYDEMQTEDYWLVNARLGLEADDGRWAVTGWVKNLEDKYYQPSLNYGNDIIFGMAGMGRTYGVSLNYNWD